MVETRAEVVEELDSHSETMRLEDFVRIVENHQPVEEPGVDRETLAAYAEEAYFDVDLSAIDERVTDSDEWVAGDHFYEVGDGQISVYPPDWHEVLAGTADLKEVIRVIQTETTEAEGEMQEAVTEEGVPEQKVLRVAETVAGIDRETVRERLKELRQRGEIEEFASQHRNPTIRLS
jgi:hypothetical protein